MSSKQARDTPEWVNRDEVDNFIQQSRMMQSPPMIGPKEHVIPIAVEKSPSKTPATPGFGPTPFYGAMNQQFNNVVGPKIVSPKVGKFNIPSASSTFSIGSVADPNANQFVNQGYNDIQFPQVTQQQARPYVQPQQQFQQPTGTRIIPIQMEGSRSPQNDQTVVMQR